MTKQIYIVSETVGEYDDAVTKPIAAYSSRKDAMEHVTVAEAQYRHEEREARATLKARFPDMLNIKCAVDLRTYNVDTLLLNPCKACKGSGQMDTGIGSMVCDECKEG